jgi:hypothetical protein
MSKFVTGVPETTVVSTPAAVLYVVPFTIAADPLTLTFNCNPVAVPVYKFGVPPATATSTPPPK